ncbi:putative dehydrogenase [Mobilisporobacter senegalensis]|uniref:Putative dehydrogenase n=1 Tax=Mobilisporobacter senegalensis TaxID=1329262 RepID=A0A3N1XXU5_9FIRM|nr:Gfo/Idh/MocA family oxidoreductase [Mobilisporobacter senegalensis]ROR31426.1 putative dehydrogenase [Mobilisporobacter senegalensis]
MMKQVNWGVLGTANIAKKVTIPAMLKANNCKLYGIAGRNKEKVDEFKETFGFEKAYYSLEEMLEDENIEAVYIPLPNNLHKEWVIKAARRGKNILCEKPLAGSEEDVKEMIRVCDEEGVIFMEAFAYLHSPVIKEIKDILDSGAIGEFSFMESTFVTPRNPDENIRMNLETLGGSVYDLGCYNISLILTMLGEEPDEVKAIAHFTEKKIDDFATAYFGFADGKKACFTTGMCSVQRGDRFFIYGTKGIIEAPVQFNQEGEISYYIVKDGVREEYTVSTPNNYTLEVEQLGRCITDGEKPYVNHDFSIINARTIDRVLKDMGYQVS